MKEGIEKKNLHYLFYKVIIRQLTILQMVVEMKKGFREKKYYCAVITSVDVESSH